jgi:hypothetical protein
MLDPMFGLAYVTTPGGPWAAGAWLYAADGNWGPGPGTLEYARSANPAAITLAGLNSANISVI